MHAASDSRFLQPGAFLQEHRGWSSSGVEWSRSVQISIKIAVLCYGLIIFTKKKYKKLKFKSVRSFCKAIPKSIGYVCNVWSKNNIYNINNNIKIILNLHDSSLSGFGCNTRPRALDVGLAARSCHKNVIIKKKKI
jgi:hypothetical protein